MNQHRDVLVQPPRAADRESRGIVVGLDGTAANWSAVSWAAAEARATGRPLRLVAATPADAPPSLTENPDREHLERLTRELLDDVSSRLGGATRHISTHVSTGEPAQALVAATAPDDLLVVGKRGGHPLSRMVLGSTSMAVAGRCRGPLVVVPEGWSVGKHVEGPITVGIDGDRDPRVLDFAFFRAQRLGVPLVVVHASYPSVRHPPSNRAVSRGSDEALHELAGVVAPWRQRHPSVSVRLATYALTPTVALLGAATDAQLLVLGRHTGPQDLGGLGPGSTPRKVLHHAPNPVAVVPQAFLSHR
jgi:nucleotide-binding universal stress UspA family protein